MKSGKFLFLAIIFLVSLLCISAVSAADEAVSDVIADTNDETVLQESIDDADLGDSKSVELEESDKDVVSADEASSVDPPSRGSFKKLNDDVNNGADVVDLSVDYDYVADYDSGFENGIEINRTVTIYGNGHTIYGSNEASIFKVNAANVIFHDIIFTKGNATYGGAIYAYQEGCLAINCTFLDNYADEFGGAIYTQSFIEPCTAINCTFTGNSARRWGGAVCYCNAVNCTFTGNSAGQCGGALRIGNAINCNFTENSAYDDGGAIHWGNATNCNFISNSAKGSSSGGAIASGNATNCNFTRNSAARFAGAIYSGYAKNCTFIENQAYRGGAFFAGNAIDSTFTDNYAEGYGGAIYNANATNCKFTNNSAGLDGGAFYVDSDLLTFAVNCNFTNNHAKQNGGAIYNGDVSGCPFTQNTAENWGGAAYNVTAKNSKFIKNYASCGGAMQYGVANNCLFTQNSADSYGGAMADANATYCNFTQNTAGGGGAAFYVNASNCIFRQNNANYGGAMQGGSAINCTFIGNTANETGDNVTGTDTDNCKFLTPTKLTSKAVATTYNINKYLVITLKDENGNALSGVYVTVTLSSAKKYKTNSNGQIKINVGKLVPKTYTAKISFAGNNNYVASSTTAKVTVKKATPKLTAKAKTFRVKVKTKKYTVTLKNNKGKVLKKVKLTLRVGKKTYKATTNSKGKATFKITKLTKKGKYTATVKFAGSKYYKKLTKKVKITVKK